MKKILFLVLVTLVFAVLLVGCSFNIEYNNSIESDKNIEITENLPSGELFYVDKITKNDDDTYTLEGEIFKYIEDTAIATYSGDIIRREGKYTRIYGPKKITINKETICNGKREIHYADKIEIVNLYQETFEKHYERFQERLNSDNKNLVLYDFKIENGKSTLITVYE